MYPRTPKGIKCRIERTTGDKMVEQKHKSCFALIVTVAVAGFDRLKGRSFQQLFGRVRLLFVFPVMLKTEKCSRRGDLCLEFVCNAVGEYS